ncbi:MAG TPA: 50S ribosomal protein L4 [Candidatus Nanoarchaeia archaeon]|nr:50S ribosomal protein L4 [Candidatus Nanoarchaeia archaeon]
MMIPVYSLQKNEGKRVELPEQFREEVRKDIIRRAVLVEQAAARQRYGAKPEAGKRASAKLSRRRRDFKGSYGLGISRVPRKILSGKGSRWNWVGAVAPGMVGGRRAHPPKSKAWGKLLNRKEEKKAIRSALAATVQREMVAGRGHRIPPEYPFALDNAFEALAKTREIVEALKRIGFSEELKRGEMVKVRAGKGKRRGRKYKGRTSLLLVAGEECAMVRAAQNIPGVHAIPVSGITANLLAPGTVPGRATLFTEHAIRKIGEQRLFL